MQILTVDVGTGTQDIYLFQSGMAPENGFKLVMPSPTMMVRRKIRSATARGDNLLLVGVTMGGGPNTWAAVEHLRAGHRIFATPEAARTFDDDLDKVREMGVEVVSEDEAANLSLPCIKLHDFDFQAIHSAFAALGADIDPQAVAVAVFDHGAAPADISDRQFRFDYIEARIRDRNNLSAFAYLAAEIPPFLTRMQSVADSTEGLTCPLIVMDTAPAAILGATLDPKVGSRKQKLIANIGNFHTLAFRMGPAGIEGVFEHHTGLVNLERVDDLLTSLAHGTLTHEEIFAEHGHGALVIDPKPLSLQDSDFGVAVTGPRQSMLSASRMRPYFAVPYGDMMLSGCFGLVSACADLLPELSESIQAALSGTHSQVAPWDAEI